MIGAECYHPFSDWMRLNCCYTDVWPGYVMIGAECYHPFSDWMRLNGCYTDVWPGYAVSLTASWTFHQYVIPVAAWVVPIRRKHVLYIVSSVDTEFHFVSWLEMSWKVAMQGYSTNVLTAKNISNIWATSDSMRERTLVRDLSNATIVRTVSVEMALWNGMREHTQERKIIYVNIVDKLLLGLTI